MTREEAIAYGKRVIGLGLNDETQAFCELAIKALEEQEPCEDCINREETKQFLYERLDRLDNDELYDIFSKIIDDMYNELPSVTPQESFKPVVEIDLYSVIKQKYIEREVLDKIRADVINIADGKRSMSVRSVVKIIDKYKAESEG
jgi:hypothetical protein